MKKGHLRLHAISQYYPTCWNCICLSYPHWLVLSCVCHSSFSLFSLSVSSQLLFCFDYWSLYILMILLFLTDAPTLWAQMIWSLCYYMKNAANWNSTCYDPRLKLIASMMKLPQILHEIFKSCGLSALFVLDKNQSK